MEVILNYWDRVSYININSEIKHEKIITVKNDIDAFEQFYKLNNSLRYCNGSYYKFKDINWGNKYNQWLKSDDYKSKSFNLYYGRGVVILNIKNKNYG
jgi:hypothetical protein